MKNSKKVISCRILDIVDTNFTKVSLSRKQFAIKLGISPQLFRKMLSGNPKMPDDVLFELVNHIQLEEDESNELYDLYASITGDIPADVREFLIENPRQIIYIRKLARCNKEGMAKRGK